MNYYVVSVVTIVRLRRADGRSGQVQTDGHVVAGSIEP